MDEKELITDIEHRKGLVDGADTAGRGAGDLLLDVVPQTGTRLLPVYRDE